MKLLTALKQRAKGLKTEIFALYLASRHPRVPWYAKVFLALIIGYALCPIDLIPDFIPIFGYLDDLIIVPGGIYLALKMIPRSVLDECRSRAKSEKIPSKAKWLALVVIIVIWLFVLFLVFRLLWSTFIR